jgi:hypothetical protein
MLQIKAISQEPSKIQLLLTQALVVKIMKPIWSMPRTHQQQFKTFLVAVNKPVGQPLPLHRPSKSQLLNHDFI